MWCKLQEDKWTTNTDLTASPGTRVKAKIWHGHSVPLWHSVHNIYIVTYKQRRRNAAGVPGQKWASRLHYLSFGCSSAEWDDDRQWLFHRAVVRLPEAISTKTVTCTLYGRKIATAFIQALLYAWAVHRHLIQSSPQKSKVDTIAVSLLGSQRLSNFHKVPQLVNGWLELSPVPSDSTWKPFHSIRQTSKR